MGAAPRKALAALLRPKLPRAWKIIPYQTNIDTPDRVVVMLKLESIVRTPAAPLGAHDVKFVVTIVSPLTDVEKAEDALDAQVDALLHKLDELGIAWTIAEKVKFDDQHLAFDISLTLTSTKE